MYQFDSGLNPLLDIGEKHPKKIKRERRIEVKQAGENKGACLEV